MLKNWVLRCELSVLYNLYHFLRVQEKNSVFTGIPRAARMEVVDYSISAIEFLYMPWNRLGQKLGLQYLVYDLQLGSMHDHGEKKSKKNISNDRRCQYGF
jgi:hypothetical protein